MKNEQLRKSGRMFRVQVCTREADKEASFMETVFIDCSFEDISSQLNVFFAKQKKKVVRVQRVSEEHGWLIAQENDDA